MIWLTWRQFRAQAITAAAALAVFAILLAATESDLSGMYNSSGLLTCHGAACAGLASQFLDQLASGGGGFLIPGSAYAIVYFVGVLIILIAPAITGVFWGAPLIARELETGTCDLAWNQSVTRTRWLAVKLTVGGLTAIAVTEALCLMQSWWAAPMGRVGPVVEERVVRELRADLDSGRWADRNQELLDLDEMDLGGRLFIVG